jgi:ElaB/YqjD/DUF883 family membrane-anchored ribosome-binding protein
METSMNDAAARPTGMNAVQPSGAAQTVASQARSMVDQAKTTAHDRARAAASNGKGAAVGTLSGLAQSMTIASQHLNDQQNGAGKFVEQAAERIERAAKYLDMNEVDDLVRRTETWARQNPAMFLGGAFVLGLLGARFLKASPPPPQQLAVSPAGPSSFSDREIATTPFVEAP